MLPDTSYVIKVNRDEGYSKKGVDILHYDYKFFAKIVKIFESCSLLNSF